jgi:hypothetical protein
MNSTDSPDTGSQGGHLPSDPGDETAPELDEEIIDLTEEVAGEEEPIIELTETVEAEEEEPIIELTEAVEAGEEEPIIELTETVEAEEEEPIIELTEAVEDGEEEPIIELTEAVEDGEEDEPAILLTEPVEAEDEEPAAEQEQIVQLTDKMVDQIFEAPESGAKAAEAQAEAEEDMLTDALQFDDGMEQDLDSEFDIASPDDDFVDSLGMEIDAEDGDESEPPATRAPEQTLATPSVQDLGAGQLEAALENVVRKLYAEKIDRILNEVIERVVTQEIGRLKQVLLEDREDSQP